MNAMVREIYSDKPRVPPQSVPAEQSVLGGLMLSPASLNMLGNTLSEDDFYRQDHRLIFRAIGELAEKSKPFDSVTLGEWFDANGLSSSVDGKYLNELAMNVHSAANIMAYAEIVRSKAVARSVIEIATHAANQAFGSDGLEVADSAINALMALAKKESKAELTLKEAMGQAYAELLDAHANPGKLRGVTSGFARLNKRLGGFHKGDLIIFGARPSVGKTALLLNMAQAAKESGKCIGVISGEQPAVQVAQRHMSMKSLIHAENLRNGEIADDDWSKLSSAMHSLADGGYRIYDRSNPTLVEVERIARKWKQMYGLDALYVDYIQRISVPGSNGRIEEVSAAGRGLKNLARDLDIPIIALAQVKASVDTRPDKRPNIGDLANSDELTREADSIIMIYRDEVYNDPSPSKGMAELLVEKNRHGPCGMIEVAFLAETMRFRDLEYDNR